MRLAGTLAAVFLACTWIAPVATSADSVPTNRAARPSAEAVEFFEKRVRPVLAEQCFGCHGPTKQKAGLRLDSRAAILKGGDTGAAAIPGDPDRSVLVLAIRHVGELKMPPRGKLPPEAIEALTTWVKLGVPWPETTVTDPVLTSADPIAEARKRHWAFQPVRQPPLPIVKNQAWARAPIDTFIQAQLEAKGLKPSPRADRRTLIRRVTFDLTGLPPTPNDLEAWLKDPSEEWFANLVERLLASPRYGERWGRHWLDVARYADSKGYVFQEERRCPFAYTYRDYVIRAFNEDLPYDQFILQQLAADQLLPLPSPPAEGEGRGRGADQRPLAAMGFLTLGRRFLNNVHDIIDDRIDVVTRGLLGMTVTCARCHEHKYDPIPIQDYYSLYGVFASSVEPPELPLIGEPEQTATYRAFTEELQKREAAVARFREEHQAELAAGNRKVRDQLRALQRKVDEWHVTAPAAPARAMVLRDAPAPVTAQVFLRGNPNNRGPVVPRQFLAVLSGDKRQPFHQGSGRLELAQAIASRDNPLTARVLVNRVWMHHFGSALVRTPSDFGLRSEPPTHPELLDYLAWRFMDDGWSIKKLHRLILLSSVYQQSSDDRPDQRRIDPENRLLGRMNRERLDFEQLRDALLAVAGDLDLTMGGRPVDIIRQPFSRRRTVYGFIDRQNLPAMFRVFDFATPDTHSPQRYTTTVPQQALFLMNSPFVVEQARKLVARPEVASQADVAQRIQYLYRLLYGRAAEAEEVALGRRFVETATKEVPPNSLTTWEKYAQVLLLANEFAFVD